MKYGKVSVDLYYIRVQVVTSFIVTPCFPQIEKLYYGKLQV